MFKKLVLFLSAFLLLLGGGRSPIETEAKQNDIDLYLPVVTTPPSPVYLPLVMTPWLDSTFGVEVHTLDNTAALWAENADTSWVRINGLNWSNYQPNNNSDFFEDPTLEYELINASRIGAKAILIINRTPLWAREYTNSVCGPIKTEKLGDFANFMRMVVQKYS